MVNIAWKKISQRVEQVGWRTAIFKTFELPNGQEKEYTTFKGGAVCTFGITKDNKIVIARQFRPGLEKVMDELPGGGIEPGEAPLDAAKREFREETGYIGDFEVLASNQPRDAYVDGVWHYYLARNCARADEVPQNDDTEFIEVAEISAEELLDNIEAGKMTDQTTALLALRKLGW